VNSSSVFKGFIVLLLVPTLAWKAAIPADNPDSLKGDLIKFLERNQFDVVVTDTMVNYQPLIQASTGACRLQVARLTQDGSNRDLIRHFAASADRTFVVFRGKVYAEQPVFWTVINYLGSRALREVGLMRHAAPVIAVAANSSCEAERLPWGELQPTS
jgi:hypothetical protein